MKKILITGKDSYIGTSFERYLIDNYPGDYSIDTVDMIDGSWREKDFSSYDSIFHVAGIAHADTRKVSKSIQRKYYEVNTDLAIETAQKAKADGAKQFIFMSSIIVYGSSGKVGRPKVINRETRPNPENFYGDSKLKAEEGIQQLEDSGFHVVILRPPMTYGPDCKGNYRTLSKMAQKFFVFPFVSNERSMIYIENLSEFIKQRIDENSTGVFFPQNTNYVNTSSTVNLIAKAHGKKIQFIPKLYTLLVLAGKFTELTNKAFGSLTYDKNLSGETQSYNVINFGQSIARTEFKHQSSKAKLKTIWILDHYASEPEYGGISRQYDFGTELSKRGYNVVVISSAFSHFKHEYITNENLSISRVNENLHFVYIHTTRYVNNDGKDRAVNMFSFLNNVLINEPVIAEKLGKPDVVTGCSVHPLTWIAAYKISRKYKIRLCVEVRDLWPEMWILGGIKAKNDPMVIFFGLLEKWIYQKADRIIYSMDYGDRYLNGQLGIAKEKCFLIGQPMDCRRFDNNAVVYSQQIPQEILSFIKNSFVCVFAGYYMTYEGVYVMLKAAQRLQQHRIPIKMLFVGSGEEEPGMKLYVKQNDLKNVYIGPRIEKEAIPALLSSSNICMAHLAIPDHLEAYKFGVSKNKVNEYLYSGDCTLYGFSDNQDNVAKTGAGFVFTPFDDEELYTDIVKVFNMSEKERNQFGINGRQFIQDNRSVEILTDKMENVLFGIS